MARTVAMRQGARDRPGLEHRLALALALASLVYALALSGCASSRPGPPLAGSRLARESSGLLASDSFDAPLTPAALAASFEFNGSAAAADRVSTSGADGLHVGVRAHSSGSFEGYFAVTHATFPLGSVFHVRMYRQPGTVAGSAASGEAVFAVQTGTTKRTGDINYVLVASSSTGGLTHWLVGYAQGRVANANTTVLWQGPFSAMADASEDVTLRTDGHRSLEVYFGARRVYVSRALQMKIDDSLQPYLEVQALTIPYDVRFQDFWVARDSAIAIRALQAGDHVTVTLAGGVSVSGVAGSGGSARLELPLDHVRSSGVLKIQRGAQQSSFPLGPVTGGDVYALRR